MKSPLRYLPYGLIVLTGMILLATIQVRYTADIAAAKEVFIEQEHLKTEALARKLAVFFERIYEGLRTISRLPSVRRIDAAADSIDKDDKKVIQEIYNNIASDVKLSEVYIVLAEENADMRSKVWKESGRPVLAFDEMIVGRSAGTVMARDEASAIEEIETFEHEQISRQLEIFASLYPDESRINGLSVPALISPQIVICDNTRFDPAHPDDRDRMGMIYAIPFFGSSGEFRGSVAGIFLTSVLTDMLTSSAYALWSPDSGHYLSFSRSGTADGARDLVEQYRPHPGQLYSELYPVKISGMDNEWYVWAGQPNAAFWNQRNVILIRNFALFGYVATSLMMLLFIVALMAYRRHRYGLDRFNRKLSQSEQETKRILETTTDAFVSIDERGMVMDWNSSAERIFGWLRVEVVGKSMSDLIIPSSLRDAHQESIRRFIATGMDPDMGKVRCMDAIHREGHEIPVEWTLWPVEINGKYRFNAFIRDITERKRLEDDLKRRNQELLGREREAMQAVRYLEKVMEERKRTQVQLLQSEKMASVGQLAAGIAHEINNPVGFISNNMEMLNLYIEDCTKLLKIAHLLKDCVARGDLQTAGTAALEMETFEREIDLDFILRDTESLLQHNLKGIERIKKIVMDLRTFAREDTGGMDLVKIEEVIDNVLSIVHNELKYKAQLVKEYGDTPQILCSSQRMGQVFINLLINAVHAIEDKGTITVRTCVSDSHVCIEITDTGKGIAEEHLGKIFDAFFTTKPVGQGTGLGLSISHEIVKKHNGEIKVKSKVGEGTTFTILLPMVKKAQAQP